jgi:Na+/H+ antiporter NhaA
MLLHAIIFLSINVGPQAGDGMGHSDGDRLAFAVGALTLLGRSNSGRTHSVFAVAVIDDVGAIVVIPCLLFVRYSWADLSGKSDAS